MNDRYLFRAKRTDSGEWVEGDLVHSVYKINDICVGKYGSDVGLHQVDESTICQCTGIKDKNGKLIWENDIVSCSGNLKVSWNKKYSGYCLEKEGWAYQHFFGEACEPCDCEVIGNIFDNPMLVYGGKNVLTPTERMNVKDRFSEYCRDKGIDETSDAMFDWLGMMDLLNEEAIKELPELKDKR